MSVSRIRIATRESRLALAQTALVAQALQARHPGIAVETVGMTTRGDKILDRPLAQVGGKGLFIKELEVALAEDRADIAVHSLKDVPMELAPGFSLSTFGAREDRRQGVVQLVSDARHRLPQRGKLFRLRELMEHIARLVLQLLSFADITHHGFDS